MMMRNAAAGGVGSGGHSGMMPLPPFDGNDFPWQQQCGGLGDGDDDDPALPDTDGDRMPD